MKSCERNRKRMGIETKRIVPIVVEKFEQQSKVPYAKERKYVPTVFFAEACDIKLYIFR